MNTREELITYINNSKFISLYEADAAIPKNIERVETRGIDAIMGRITYEDCDKKYFCIQGYYKPFQDISTPSVKAFCCKKELGYVYVPDFWGQQKITDEQREEICKQVNDLIGV